MINTKALSQQLSDLNVALGLFRKQIENVVAVNSDKNQITSQVSSAIREYVSMYTGLQMLHSSENAVVDMTEQTRQVISSTPFLELRDTLVKMYNRMETSCVKIPLITTLDKQGLSIRETNILNAQLTATSSKWIVKIVNSDILYTDSLGVVDIMHDGSSNRSGYLDDFRLMSYNGNRVGIPFKVFTFLIPNEMREPMRLYHTQGAPVENYIPWSFNLAFSWISNSKITFGAEILFKSTSNGPFFSISKWGNQSFVNDHPSNYLLVEDNIIVDTDYNRLTFTGPNSYFGTPIPDEMDESSNSVIFTDAALVAVTKTSLGKLIKAVNEIVR